MTWATMRFSEVGVVPTVAWEDGAVVRKVNRKTLRTRPLLEWSDLKIPEVIFKVDRNGGTLEQVAKKYGRSTNVLWTANFDVLGQMLMPIDTRLTIPDPKANRYEVRERDNLNKIAVMLGVSVDDMKKANPEVQGLQPEDPLTVGITLKIPEQDIGQMASRKNVLEQLIANPVRTLYKYPTIHSLSKPNELPDRIINKFPETFRLQSRQFLDIRSTVETERLCGFF